MQRQCQQYTNGILMTQTTQTNSHDNEQYKRDEDVNHMKTLIEYI